MTPFRALLPDWPRSVETDALFPTGRAHWFQEAWHRADMVLFTPKLRFLRPEGARGSRRRTAPRFSLLAAKVLWRSSEPLWQKPGFWGVQFAIA